MGAEEVKPFPFARGGFIASLPFDRRLAKADVLGSLAHAAMLTRAGILSPEDGAAIARGLRAIHREIAEGRFPFDDELEDIHTNVEARLRELVGDAAKGLHTARSRNDQVALDERLWLREALLPILRGVHGLQLTLVRRARESPSAVIPGYSHLQRAQPLLLAHHLLAHAWALGRDFDRLARVFREASVSPLGAGALAGSSLPVDPGYAAQLLGLDGTFDNSLDAVQDRDYMASFLFSAALLALHLARLGEDLVLWATAEFGFVHPGPGAGGSSLMAHKRNPDVAELVRAKAGRILGDLVALLAVLKGLPSGYQRDLQEDKPPVFDAADTLLASLAALEAFVASVQFDEEAMERAAQDPRLLSVDRIEALVVQGIPFRDAYAAVARAPGEIPGGGAEAPGDPRTSVGRRTSHGGTSPGSVARQLQSLDAVLSRQLHLLGGMEGEVARAEGLLSDDPQSSRQG